MRIKIILLYIIGSFILICAVSGQQITSISYNIKNDYQKEGENNWTSRKEKMIELLNHYQPEVIGVQEALLNQVEYIDNNLSKFNYIGVGRDDGKQAGEYCAIYYNTKSLKLIEEATFWLSETPDEISTGWDAALPRICTYGLFEHIESKTKVWIINSHFDHIGVLARENSAKLILKRLEKLNSENYPVILMGDFNALAMDKPIQVFKSGLTDAMQVSEEPPYGPSGTFNGFTDETIDKRIDYFFVKNLKVISYVHIDDRLDSNKHISDHLPVLISTSFLKE